MSDENQAAGTESQTNTDAQGADTQGANAQEGNENRGLLGGEKEGEGLLTGDRGEGSGESKAPEEYTDFKLPEGMEIDPKLLADFSATAKSLNLSQENAQKIVDLMSTHTDASSQKQADLWKEQRKAWVNEIKSDKDFGGAKFNETVERANRALVKFSDQKFIDYLKTTGMCDNSGLVRLLANVDKAMGEDNFVDGTPLGKKELSAAQVLYGTN